MRILPYIQFSALTLLFAVVIICLYQYLRYQKIKRLYRADYARACCLKNISGLLLFMPKHKSRRYKKTEALLIDSGIGISVEGFYLIKTILFIVSFAFLTSIQSTNAELLFKSIIEDVNIEKTMTDSIVEPSESKVRLEKDIFKYADNCLPREKIPLKQLSDKHNSQMYIEFLEVLIREEFMNLEEDAGAAAKRMYSKLIRVRSLETDYAKYAFTLSLIILLYFLPDLVCHVKLKLIEDRRDWEVLNFVYVFSIFGRMPPFNIKNVLLNTLVVSDIYRPVIKEALNGIRSGRGEAAFDSILPKIDNEELYELLETMRLAVGTGLLNIVETVDDMALNQLKWLEIKGIKRRKSKQVIAMVPVVLVMLIAAVYFSYSLSILSNPMNFIK